MKLKTLLLIFGLLSFVFAKANNVDARIQTGSKDDLNGTVVCSDTKKPIKNVSITAYSTSKKEKVVKTDESGNYSFDELEPGVYKFIFEKSGFKKVTKEKIVVKTDESFQLNIEMIENNDFDLMPSPFHFINVK